MKHNLVLAVLTLLIFIGFEASAQKKSKDKVLLSIDNQDFTVSEFMYGFNKNNVKGAVVDQKSLDEYLDLYINFRLKVKEAEDLGLDTLADFKREFLGYRKELAQPYLTDKSEDEAILKEAYDRYQYDIRASHIMISLPENVADNDSIAVAAYNKLMDIRKKALAGEDFADLARKYSDDPSARDMEATNSRPAHKGNGGDLGYFTAFYMVYPFETAAYSTPVGEISKPIRTRYGYHIIKVTDKIPALGNIHVAHINVKPSKDDPESAKKKIDEILSEIKSGKLTFEEAAQKYSSDRGSAEKGGVLPWFEVSRMVPEFIAAISKLSVGQISEPVETEYGWHIIKLLELKKVPPYEQYLPELRKRAKRDSRSNIGREAAIAKFKKEFKFKEYKKALNEFYTVVDSTIFFKQWNASKAQGLTSTLFRLDGHKYTQQDFAKYIEQHQASFKSGTIRFYVNKVYKDWVDKTVIEYKDSKLEDQYFDFRMLVNEYHDGILTFSMSDKEVWGKAIRDTVGLEKFYEEHKDNYMWKERVDAEIFKCTNDSVAKVVRQYLNQGLEYDSIQKLVNKKSSLNLGYEKGLYEPGQNPIIDKQEKKVGISDNIKDNKSILIVKINKIIPPENKKLDEARGLITADYQNYLEKEWLKSLHEKHKVVVHEDVLNEIKEELK
ncbi:MAG: peptidylprolyl isomerase [Bacteroidetes bacterium]|nr:MAG: peptidylprolyl isomerase [Bacteroidota bacterium]